MQIRICVIQQHHPLALVKTLNNRVEGLHVEFWNTKVRVESTEVEDGAEPTNAVGSQKVMVIKSALVLWQLDCLHAPLDKEGCNFFPPCLSLHLQLWQQPLDRGPRQRKRTSHKREWIALLDHLQNKPVWGYLLPGRQEKAQPRPPYGVTYFLVILTRSHTWPGRSW